MFPSKKDYILNLNLFGEIYQLKFSEATAEESTFFYDNIKNTKDFLEWLPAFINGLDNLSQTQKNKIIKSIYGNLEDSIQSIYKQITETRYRAYESKYKGVKTRPKPKGSGTTTSSPQSSELKLSQATMIPINLLNKELTLYQRGWIEDGIICDALNSYTEGQKFNNKIRRENKVNIETDEYIEAKKKITTFEERIKALDAKNKNG